MIKYDIILFVKILNHYHSNIVFIVLNHNYIAVIRGLYYHTIILKYTLSQISVYTSRS